MFDEDDLSDVEGADSSKGVEESEKIQAVQLTKETICDGLSLLCRTGNRLGHAFIKLHLNNKGLDSIAAISSYIHIRFLDLSNNYIADLSPLATLKDLLWLKVDNNVVASFKGQPFPELSFLQWLSMAANRLTDLDGLAGPALESLDLTGNRIQQLNGFQSSHFANLVTLELRGNHLDTTDGINLPNLRKLYLAKNVIKRLEGLEKLERLTVLHLRNNQLESLDGLSPSMKCLHYLNVRGNLISDEKAIQSVGHVSQTLRALVLSENLLAEISDYRLSVLIILPQLERLDKDPVSSEERSEAQIMFRELNEEEILEP
ncbi:leucine-rich repeat-containing protein 23 [Nematolebias whitei]|uniref:leucine-rich repeat-containing protein 23 n=1 Tax=Nematolebias whitei TaxID=451745 RepID=UPI00189C3DFF|nr:leucine-rich repeat-containing protein 23 [Nematolebias whitei]